jgi:hypothetical protein
MIVDSGAGETFVTTEVYRALGSPSLNDTITVADVSNTVTTARSFGPLFAFVKNVHGAWVRVLLAQKAYTSEAFGVNLFIVGAGLRLGWEAMFKSNLLRSDAEVIPLLADCNTWSFPMRVAAEPLGAEHTSLQVDASNGPVDHPIPASLPIVYAQSV